MINRDKRKFRIYRIAFVLLMIAACATGWLNYKGKNQEEPLGTKQVKKVVETTAFETKDITDAIIKKYAKQKGYKLSDYPSSLRKLFKAHRETKTFVLEYPEKKDKKYKIDLSKYKTSSSIPLLMQWDQRWGYSKYAGDCIGITGCGPTCLSMVTIYLTKDTSKNPKWMANFAEKNKYADEKNGSAWTLISEGGKKLGLNVTQIPMNEKRVISNLEVGNPIICVVGPGDFTTSGHFIVLTGYKDGEISVNDPNSTTNSNKTWTFDKIASQTKNLWVLTK